METCCKNAPPEWHLNEEGALVRDTIHSMLRRCNGWDYSQPAVYMITIVLADRRSMALGKVLADSIGEHTAEYHAHCELTALGQAVADSWEAIPSYYPQVELICQQVMPDHFHGIFRVKERLPCHLGQVIKGFKLGCNKAARAICPAALGPGGGLFAEGFNDTILFRKGQLEKMVAYVKSNSLRLAIKRVHHELFKKVDDLAVEGLHFSAIGNRFLLERPMAQVQCSRRYFAYKRVATRGKPKIARDAAGEPIAETVTPEYEALKDTLLAAARHGMVLISPCISDGERQIAREAFKAGGLACDDAQQGLLEVPEAERTVLRCMRRRSAADARPRRLAVHDAGKAHAARRRRGHEPPLPMARGRRRRRDKLQRHEAREHRPNRQRGGTVLGDSIAEHIGAQQGPLPIGIGKRRLI